MPDRLTDTDRVVCQDCGLGLVANDMWEPVLMYARTDEPHTAICQACIADIADIGYHEIIQQCRKELSAQ